MARKRILANLVRRADLLVGQDAIMEPDGASSPRIGLRPVPKTRVRCFYGTEGGSWKEGLHENSSLKLFGSAQLGKGGCR